MKHKGNPTGPDILRLIVRRIANGKFRPGDRLIPAVIARELGSSAIPVREALCQLVGRDIITERRHKGFTIAPMTSATLQALYAAHGDIIQQALQRWPVGLFSPGRTRNRWLLFTVIAERSGDDVIAGIQGYLAGRLALVRRFEETYFLAEDLKWNIAESLRNGDIIAAKALSAHFHDAGESAASSIWRIMTDR